MRTNQLSAWSTIRYLGENRSDKIIRTRLHLRPGDWDGGANSRTSTAAWNTCSLQSEANEAPRLWIGPSRPANEGGEQSGRSCSRHSRLPPHGALSWGNERTLSSDIGQTLRGDCSGTDCMIFYWLRKRHVSKCLPRLSHASKSFGGLPDWFLT